MHLSPVASDSAVVCFAVWTQLFYGFRPCQGCRPLAQRMTLGHMQNGARCSGEANCCGCATPPQLARILQQLRDIVLGTHCSYCCTPRQRTLVLQPIQGVASVHLLVLLCCVAHLIF